MKRLLYASLLLLFSCSKPGSTSKPLRKDLTQAVYASGKIFPVNHYSLFSKFPGYVEKIHVHVGDRIMAGQPLVTIQNQLNDLNVNSAKNLLQLAQQNADENGSVFISLKQEVMAAGSKYELDSINFIRTSVLMKENATSKLNYDQSKTQLDASKATFIRAQQNLNNSRERLKVELLNAKNQLNAQLSNRNDYNILSVINGKVYDIIPEVGDLVNPQIQLMEIGDSSSFEVELAVDETDLSFIRQNQEVVYTIDAYPNRIFHGKIIEIYPKVNVLSKTSRVKANFEDSPGIVLSSGMSVEANIIIAEKKDVLVVPREFLKDGKVKVKGDDKLREIKTGASDLQFVEILSGVSENDVLVKQ